MKTIKPFPTLLALSLLFCPLLGQAQNVCERATSSLPQVQGETGSQFGRRIEVLPKGEREVAILREILKGNMPSFLKHAAPVTLQGPLPNGKTAYVTFCVLPDYLSIGSNEDHLLIPMGLPTAWAAATTLGFSLPTSKMVNAIYQQSSVKLSPQPLPAGDKMTSTHYYALHNAMTQAQMMAKRGQLGLLTSGHKKDLVLSNALWSHPGRVAIYGWHTTSSDPIQPLSTVHESSYADYSHGVRLVSPIAYFNGIPVPLLSLMADPRTASILSDEGALTAVAR